MYKVHKYTYDGETNKYFTKGNDYYLRNGKSGIGKFLTTDTKCDLIVYSGKLSHVGYKVRNLLVTEFTYKNYEFYKNHREFRDNIDSKQ